MYKHSGKTLTQSFLWLFLACLLSLPKAYAVAKTQPSAKDPFSPVGYWRTIDDVSHKPRSIVQIIEVNGHLEGYIRKVYYTPGEGPSDRCIKCTGDLHNKLILNMRILWDFTKVGDRWLDGIIVDPHTGKIYHCRLSVQNGGKNLDVHGYIAIPLFGRSQIWERVNKVA